MQTFATTCGIVLPTFLLIALGYALRQLGVINDTMSEGGNVLAFRVLIPCMVFYNIYSSPLQSLVNWGLMLFAAGSITVLFVALMLLVPLLEKDAARRGVIVQGVFRSSFLVLGMGLVSSLYGAQNTGVTAMLSAVVAPVFNIFAVVALEVYGTGKNDWKRIVRGIVTNPLIIGSVLAVAMLLLGLRLPLVVEKVVSPLSGMATPFALMILGSAFRFGGVRGNLRPLAVACLGKLVVVPLVFVPLSVMLGYRGVELLTLLVLFASPTAVASHVMAYNAGGDGELAGQVVVLSTCFSMITLFAFIYTLLSRGYL